MKPSYQQGITRYLQRVRAARSFDAGRVAAPADRAKRKFLLELFKQRGHRLFVESGTFQGGTVEYFVPHARRIISVEIEPELHAAARSRFAANAAVELLLGDALDVIPRVLEQVTEAPFVYLDGHFTGGINREPGEFIEPAPAILDRLGDLELPEGTTVVVDDLRLFGRGDWFPRLDELTGSARRAFAGAEQYVGIDCLVIAA